MPSGNQQKNSNQSDVKMLISFIIMAVIFTSIFNIFVSSITMRRATEITYTQFLTMLENKQVDTVEIQSDRLVITEKPEQNNEVGFYTNIGKQYYTGIVNDPVLTDRIIKAGATQYREVQNNSPIITFLASWALPFLLIYIISGLIIRSVSKKMGGVGGPMSFGKNTAKIYAQKETGVTFADVA